MGTSASLWLQAKLAWPNAARVRCLYHETIYSRLVACLLTCYQVTAPIATRIVQVISRAY